MVFIIMIIPSYTDLVVKMTIQVEHETDFKKQP